MFWSFVRDNPLTKLLFCLNQYGVNRMLTYKRKKSDSHELDFSITKTLTI